MVELWKPIIVRYIEELGAVLKPYLMEPRLLLLLMAAAGLVMLGLLCVVLRRKPAASHLYNSIHQPASTLERVVKLEHALHDIQKKLNLLADLYREKADELKEQVAVMREALKLFEKGQRNKKQVADEEFLQVTKDIAAVKSALEALVQASSERRLVKPVVEEEPGNKRTEAALAQAVEEIPPVSRVAYTADSAAACYPAGAARQVKQNLERSNRDFLTERLRAAPVHYHLVKQAG